QDRQGLCR
ncbi:hypothetical protein ME783_02510, partial [Lactobacillus delbrueckii]